VVCRRVTANRRKQGALWRPAFLNSIHHSPVLDAKQIAPLSKAFCLAIECCQNIVPSVARLFDRCRPTHISRFIISVYVKSVQGMFGAWSWSNVVIKSLKIVEPFVCNGNTATAVSLVIRRFRVGTAILDMPPCVILSRARTSMQNGCLSAKARLASAGLVLSDFHVAVSDRYFFPAITTNPPVAVFRGRPLTINVENCQ